VLERGDRPGVIMVVQQEEAEIAIGLDEARVALHGKTVFLRRTVQIAAVVKRFGQAIMRIRAVALEFGRRPKDFSRSTELRFQIFLGWPLRAWLDELGGGGTSVIGGCSDGVNQDKRQDKPGEGGTHERILGKPCDWLQ